MLLRHLKVRPLSCSFIVKRQQLMNISSLLPTEPLPGCIQMFIPLKHCSDQWGLLRRGFGLFQQFSHKADLGPLFVTQNIILDSKLSNKSCHLLLSQLMIKTLQNFSHSLRYVQSQRIKKYMITLLERLK